MLYYNFENYEGFQSMFGIQRHGNGNKSRKNKILLSFLKNRNILHDAIQTGDNSLLDISDMTDLKNKMKTMIRESGMIDESLCYEVNLINETYYSAQYSSDGNNGLCEDGDSRAVRYINHTNDNRIFKMKAGKFYRALILETEFGKKLPEQVINFLCEEFASDWQSYAFNSLPQNQLFVNDDFQYIYDSRNYLGDFRSCMVNKDLHTFYNDAVKAKAAFLENSNGQIIARCVIYTDATDQDGNKWRLAERQYASDGSTIYCRALVDALIREGHIDGYKVPGAGCGEARNFVDLHGASLSHKQFSIECNLDWEDCLSYQDSFKWYDMDKRIATNFGRGEYDLATTDGSLAEESPWDDYHEEYCEETTTVYVHGREYQCASNWLDDFRWVDGIEEYHHIDDVELCAYCENHWVLVRDAYTSDLIDNGKYYCCESCLIDAEFEYREKMGILEECEELSL